MPEQGHSPNHEIIHLDPEIKEDLDLLSEFCLVAGQDLSEHVEDLESVEHGETITKTAKRIRERFQLDR